MIRQRTRNVKTKYKKIPHPQTGFIYEKLNAQKRIRPCWIGCKNRLPNPRQLQIAIHRFPRPINRLQRGTFSIHRKML